MSKDEALSLAWDAVGGKSEFTPGEISFMESLTEYADADSPEMVDPIAHEALRSGQVRSQSSTPVVVFLMEFCRHYIGE